MPIKPNRLDVILDAVKDLASTVIPSQILLCVQNDGKRCPGIKRATLCNPKSENKNLKSVPVEFAGTLVF
jgi:hypothetical protein